MGRPRSGANGELIRGQLLAKGRVAFLRLMEVVRGIVYTQVIFLHCGAWLRESSIVRGYQGSGAARLPPNAFHSELSTIPRRLGMVSNHISLCPVPPAMDRSPIIMVYPSYGMYLVLLRASTNAYAICHILLAGYLASGNRTDPECIPEWLELDCKWDPRAD